MDDLSIANLEARVEEAISRAARRTEFLKRFPQTPPDSRDLLPAIDWTQIERQLRSLAGPNFERVPWEVEVLKASARLNPPEMLYRDLLILAWSLIDDRTPYIRDVEEAPMN